MKMKLITVWQRCCLAVFTTMAYLQKQMQKVWDKLLEYYHPPFQSVEVRKEIGDGVTVGER